MPASTVMTLADMVSLVPDGAAVALEGRVTASGLTT